MTFHQKILAERERQIEKWGNNDLNLSELIMILTEEVGEVAKEAHDLHFAYEYDTPGNTDRLRDEIIQAATVLKRIYDSITDQKHTLQWKQ